MREVLLNRLLNEMDGLREEAAILFVLTTNQPEQLEAALASRPGRVDQAIEFPLPDEEGRRKLIRLYSRGMTLSDELVEVAVRKTKGASAAFIKELMRRSAQFLIEIDGKGDLRLPHIESALDEMLFTGGSLNAKLLGATATNCSGVNGKRLSGEFGDHGFSATTLPLRQMKMGVPCMRAVLRAARAERRRARPTAAEKADGLIFVVFFTGLVRSGAESHPNYRTLTRHLQADDRSVENLSNCG